MFEAYKPRDYEKSFFKETEDAKRPNSLHKASNQRKRNPLHKVSPKRKDENKVYEAAKIVWRKERESIDGFRCEVVENESRCAKRADRNPHHKFGRAGKRLADKNGFMAVCGSHHRYIHDNPQWARENHYLTYTFTKV